MKHLTSQTLVLSLLGGLLAAFALPAQAQRSFNDLQVGSKAPDFKLRGAKGAEYKLSAFRGKRAVVLDFGSFGCPPCRTAMQDLEKLHRRFQSQGLLIFGVNLDGSQAAINQGRKELNLSFLMVPDSGDKVAQAYGIEVMPSLLFVDPQGIIRYRDVGYDPDLTGIISRLFGKYHPQVAAVVAKPTPLSTRPRAGKSSSSHTPKPIPVYKPGAHPVVKLAHVPAKPAYKVKSAKARKPVLTHKPAHKATHKPKVRKATKPIKPVKPGSKTTGKPVPTSRRGLNHAPGA